MLALLLDSSDAPMPGPKRSKKSVVVHSTTQLIPQIMSLIEYALQGPSIRDDVAEGVEESKRIRSVAEEKIKLEKTIWTNVKKTWTEKRDAALEAEQKAKEKLKEGETLPASEAFDLKQWKEDVRPPLFSTADPLLKYLSF